MLAVFTAIAIGNGVYYFGLSIPYQLWVSVLFGLLYLIAVLGFTFFFSSLFKSSSISILVTAILFLFAFQIIQTLVSVFAQIEPWFILTYGSGIIGNVLADTYPTTQPIRGAGPGGREGTTFAVTIPEGLTIIPGYFVVTAILFLFAFQIIQTLVSVFAQIEPWFILTYGSGIIGNVLADTYPTTQPITGAGPGGREGTTFAVTIPEGLTIILGYFVVTAILGLLLFQRKGFTYK